MPVASVTVLMLLVKPSITISGHASVHAEAQDYSAAIGSDTSSATVNIEDHADVTAVSHSVAIGTSEVAMSIMEAPPL